MNVPSLLRRAEHQAISTVTLGGKVLDLGGEKDAEYLSCLKGSFTVTTLNLDPEAKPDIVHDLEKTIPLPDASFDHVLLVNVLEHIFNYRELLAEATRIVKPGGSVIIIVPFLFPIHPSPRDYWRFTADALERECELAGLRVEKIEPLGSGVFAARYLMLDRLLPESLRALDVALCRPLTAVSDRWFAGLARMMGKRYTPAEYPLGYLAVARKRP